MRLTDKLWVALADVLTWITPNNFDPRQEVGSVQQPLLDSLEWPVGPSTLDTGATTSGTGDPIFKPPTGRPEDTDFRCDYTAMSGWRPCSSPSNRECWLRHPDGREFNIMTDYEREAPIGVQRNYTLVVNDGWINADGRNLTEAKMFNNTYPGPWIQACWGDTLNIKVINNMKHNGTAIHWHGIRQNQTSHADGVAGLTQCPIAPGDSYTYTFKAVQYGSSWYHSHYSVQYADGLHGPLTIHGPDTADFDEPKQPILMTDWEHDSGFRSIYTLDQKYPDIILNGRGNATRFNASNPPPDSPIPEPLTLQFEKRQIGQNGRAKRYLLRLINTSFRNTYRFSIDNHVLQVIDMDFVPIEPYFTTSVLIGIGQRYRVIVEARPDDADDGSNPVPEDGNFWIRTYGADLCSTIGEAGYERTGIVRYDNTSTSEPTSQPWPDVPTNLFCADEPYASLVPKQPWTVGPAANTIDGETFSVEPNISTHLQPGPRPFPLAKFAFQLETSDEYTPFQINYSHPIIQELDDTNGNWPEQWFVVPENFNSSSWVYLVLTGDKLNGSTVGAHPIHLHGHDFALLQQSNELYSPDKLNLKLDNPPRRDVVLLPQDGFVVIAFKADNPGAWLMHCHIAFHASQGLALQILERQADANTLFNTPGSPITEETERVCANWDKWYGDCNNWWAGCDGNGHVFQDDSGI